MGQLRNNTANSKYMQGAYICRNPQKYAGDSSKIFLRSSWERRVAIFLDNNPSVLKWSSEEVVINYISPLDGKQHRYFIDFYARISQPNGKFKEYLIEVKPSKDGKPPKNINRKKAQTVLYEEQTFIINQAKWAAARKFAERHGMEFKVLTESEIFGK